MSKMKDMDSDNSGVNNKVNQGGSSSSDIKIYIQPVFFKDRDYAANEADNDLTNFTVYKAMGKIIGDQAVEGVQRVKSVWRLYSKTKEDRIQLLTREYIVLKGKRIKLYDNNPFDNQPWVKQIREKVTIKDLPASVTNSEISNYLLDAGIIIPESGVRYGLIRDDTTNDLTTVKNGDRYAYVNGPITPIMKRNITISGNRCRLFHDGQFKKHCKVCCMPSHITGDVSCPARNVGPPIVAFRSQHSVFSNFFKCDINVFDQKFISTEHAYQWKAATEAGMNDLAEKIKKADHAGIAKSLSKSIPQANRIEWEKKNTDVMEEIIFAKAEQVPEFRQALLETDGDILAEATADTFWASGMPPDLTEITNPEYWPGMNMLGHIIMKVCKVITDGEKSHYDEQDHSNYLDNSTLVTATDERALTEVVVHSTPNTTGHISRKDIGSSRY